MPSNIGWQRIASDIYYLDTPLKERRGTEKIKGKKRKGEHAVAIKYQFLKTYS